jgi:methyltransferase (TIGR00027 family)
MKNGRSSDTALFSALARAAHLIFDEKPWIFEDTLAAAFSGMGDQGSLLSAWSSLEKELTERSSPAVAQLWLRSARAAVTARSRYVEDEIQNAMERGVAQYVILGAGYDSFAYRRRELVSSLRVFEVDYPATQQQKQARLQDMKVTAPPNLTFVPVDFEQQGIMRALRDAGYRDDAPSFVSWLGVTWYLSEDAIFETLRQLASAAKGSHVVFDYVLASALSDEDDRLILTALESLAADRGEPGRTSFTPADLATRVKEQGFASVSDSDGQAAIARYFADRADGLRHPGFIRMLHAQVG